MSKVIAVSKSRYNGGVAVKRAHGSATVTTFWVFRAEDEKDPSKWVEVNGYGPTPGDRKTYAIKKFLASHPSKEAQ